MCRSRRRFTSEKKGLLARDINDTTEDLHYSMSSNVHYVIRNFQRIVTLVEVGATATLTL
jgi:hypothetical protein